MGSIGGLLGLQGGAGGTGFNVTPGTDAGQLQSSYNGAQNSIQSQQALLQALQQQNGLGNQNQVYNQLQGVANGTGPNPAQAMLNNATGQNVANQAALMAGQRGAGSNVGLIARQAGQQGAATQQNAVGQGAALQAQQSLGALGQAGALANQQAGQQIGQTNQNANSAMTEQQLLQNANSQNNAVQGSLANTTMQGQQGLIGGLLGGLGTALGTPAKAQGGMIGYADGGVTPGPQSSLGQFMSGMGTAMGNGSGSEALGSGMSSLMGGVVNQARGAPATPMADALMGSQFAGTSPGFGVMPAAAAPSPSLGVGSLMSGGGNVGNKLKEGGGVPGKAKVEGNSYANDNVKALLSPGEGVIDRETMADPGQAGQMARLLMSIVNAKKKAKK